MQPVKLTIEGKFWDTQVYMGFLYLFARDGSLVVIDWDRLINDLGHRTNQLFATEAALRRSDHLYGPSARMFLNDPEVKAVVLNHFETLARTELYVDRFALERFVVQHTVSPSPFPHADSVLYNSLLYTVGRSGVYCSPCETLRKGTPVGEGVRRWDGPASACSASYNTVALATGESGLFEMISGSAYRGELQIPKTEPRLIVEKHCTDCSWSFFNIFGTSRQSGSFLVQYKLNRDRRDRREPESPEELEEGEWATELEEAMRPDVPRRTFERVIEERELFGGDSNGYEIAYQNKLYRVLDRRISIVRANPYAKDVDKRLSTFGEVRIEHWKGSLVSAKAAVFGVVLEYDEALVVIGTGSDDNPETHTVPGEPVSWRVFPRSANYRNHLHVIRDDALEVWSFNHDYFVDQNNKKMGTRYSDVSGWRGR